MFRTWCREVGLDDERTRYVLQRGNVIAKPEVRAELEQILSLVEGLDLGAKEGARL